MAGANTIESALGVARDNGTLVCIQRAGIDRPEVLDAGFVLQLSTELVLLQLVTDRVTLDGYDLLRVDDVTMCEVVFPKSEFYRIGLAEKHLQPTNSAPLDLRGMKEALSSIQAHYSLVVIHRERLVSDECEIGRVRLSAGDHYVLDWMSPQAIWEYDSRLFRYVDITRVQFGHEYERTLELVAARRGHRLPPSES